MKNILLGGGGLIIAAAAYLTLWPVAIDPVSWDAPQSAGYVGDFAPNNALADMERLPIGDTYGPEDVAILPTNLGYRVFVSGHQGEIIEINPDTQSYSVVANTGGVPLGIEFAPMNARGDALLMIADAYRGLMSLNVMTGELLLLTNSVTGSDGQQSPILYADDVDVAPNGVVYFSDASTKFGARESGGTMAGSLLEIMEMGKTGRILSYDPRDKTTRVVADGFSFSNGVAMSADGMSLLVVETGTYSVQRLWLSGARRGEREVLIDNLPGFPDNINHGPNGSYYIGLISQRSDWLDDNSAKPAMRKLAMRLPPILRPKATDYTHIVQINGQGRVLRTFQDPSGAYPQATGAVMAPSGHLYVSSLSADSLARKKIN